MSAGSASPQMHFPSLANFHVHHSYSTAMFPSLIAFAMSNNKKVQRVGFKEVSESQKRLKHKLNKILVRDIVPGVPDSLKVVFLDGQTQLMEALRILSSNNILSAPVHDEEGDLLGFIDVLDIVTFLSLSNKQAGNSYGDVVHLNFDCKKLLNLNALSRGPIQKEVNLKTPLSKVILGMSMNKILRVAVMDDGTDLHHHQSRFKKALKRVKQNDSNPNSPITSSPAASEEERGTHLSRLHTILTQTDILNALATEAKEIYHKKLDLSIESSGLGLCHVACCQINDVTAEAFLKLKELGCYGALVVVDENGKLINFLSGAHVKGISGADLSDLMLPLGAFFQKHPEKRCKVMKPSALLRDVMHCIIDERYHWVFFVSDDEKPIGMLSLTGFMDEIAGFLQDNSRKS